MKLIEINKKKYKKERLRWRTKPSWCHHIEIYVLSSFLFVNNAKARKISGFATTQRLTSVHFFISAFYVNVSVIYVLLTDFDIETTDICRGSFFLSLQSFLSLVFQCSFAIKKFSFFASTESRSKLNVMHLIRVIDNLPKRQQRKYASSNSSEILYTALTISSSFAHLWRYFNVIQGIQQSMLFSLQLPNNRFIYLRPSCHFEI